MAGLQDVADQASRNRSPRALADTQRQLLHTGIDSRIVVNDIVRYAQTPWWKSTPQSVLQTRRIMRNPGTAAPPQMFVPGTPGCHCPRLGHMITKANVRVTNRLIPVPNNRSSRVRPGTEAGTRTARSGSMATKVAATASATW